MTTAAARLVSLSGLGSATAAAHLLAIGSGATAGAALVAYSGLTTGTAAEHLLANRAAAAPTASGAWWPHRDPFATPRKKPRRRREEVEFALM